MNMPPFWLFPKKLGDTGFYEDGRTQNKMSALLVHPSLHKRGFKLTHNIIINSHGHLHLQIKSRTKDIAGWKFSLQGSFCLSKSETCNRHLYAAERLLPFHSSTSSNSFFGTGWVQKVCKIYFSLFCPSFVFIFHKSNRSSCTNVCRKHLGFPYLIFLFCQPVMG